MQLKNDTRAMSGVVSGFTLIELMVTVSLLAILVGIAIPSMRAFIWNAQTSSISNEFVADIARTQRSARNSNTCVTMCQSANVLRMTDGSANFPSCDTSKNEWNYDATTPGRGWIIFENPSCDDGETFAGVSKNSTAGSTNGLQFIAAHQEGPSGFSLKSPGSEHLRFSFDARGLTSVVNGAATLSLSNPSGVAVRTICVGAAGRVIIKSSTESCP